MLHFIDTWIPGKITTFHWKPQWKWKQMKIKSLQLICPQCLSVSTSDVYKFPIERRRHTNKFHQFTARNLFQSGFEIQIECNVHGCDCFRSSLHRKQHLKLANEKICLYTINHSIGTNLIFFLSSVWLNYVCMRDGTKCHSSTVSHSRTGNIKRYSAQLLDSYPMQCRWLFWHNIPSMGFERTTHTQTECWFNADRKWPNNAMEIQTQYFFSDFSFLVCFFFTFASQSNLIYS